MAHSGQWGAISLFGNIILSIVSHSIFALTTHNTLNKIRCCCGWKFGSNEGKKKYCYHSNMKQYHKPVLFFAFVSLWSCCCCCGVAHFLIISAAPRCTSTNDSIFTIKLKKRLGSSWTKVNAKDSDGNTVGDFVLILFYFVDFFIFFVCMLKRCIGSCRGCQMG
jgi:hypothetical protein